MRTYVFETEVTMKEYNRKNWWIDSDVVGKFETEAATLKEALENFREYVENDCYISISDNAMRTKNAMYITTRDGEDRQEGYVITGKTDFQDDSGRWSEQYIDLWVRIRAIESIDFAA